MFLVAAENDRLLIQGVVGNGTPTMVFEDLVVGLDCFFVFLLLSVAVGNFEEKRFGTFESLVFGIEFEVKLLGFAILVEPEFAVRELPVFLDEEQTDIVQSLVGVTDGFCIIEELLRK
ncbi:MAG: hypothetical protein AUJ92_02885 [Armatimonadetes bacterium CG2_30_59_28]|nr:MAG: hypothetical protein AUJ92_02885 [Armatimonadetes bacterium CG2_30_59_28]PIU63437.1 MAG: hypothetical protein COS85_16070 [Armatimonadetes bacterium CG07_land_8_20_14_0_80_59_28]PIY38135.1 MAG: hypothetical protein COZ05_21295 [Armatimonadetes bacterium CG_4_10_14_3_um_filter_59_10]